MSSARLSSEGEPVVASGSGPSKTPSQITTESKQTTTTSQNDDSDDDSEDEDFTEETALHEEEADEAGPSIAPRSRKQEELDGEEDEGENQVEDDELKFLKREAEEDNAPGQERGRGKRLKKVEEDQKQNLVSQAISEDKASKAWSDFLDTPAESSSKSQDEETITITERYTFANEVQTRERVLPKSHPDAIAYLAAQQKKSKASPPAPLPQSTPSPSASTSRGPKPRKRTSKLSKLSSSLNAEAPKKLNTLEKSSLDWSNSLNDSEKQELNDQSLGKNRNNNDMSGYLQRRDFLERVQERTDGQRRP